MYLINTSFFVEPVAHDLWLGVMREKFLPFLRERQCSVVSFCRVLGAEAEEHFTYSLLTGASDMPAYDRYMQEMLGEYERLAGLMFEGRVTSFTTLLKNVNNE
jgi:hypothetical protein